jgi:AbrB family looped-hinge helix DNA binding protein
MSTHIKDTDERKRRREMSRVQVRRGADITWLPEEARQKLRLAEGDYLEVEVVEDGVLLRPSRESRRRAALERIRKAQAGVHYIGPEPRPSPEEEEQVIAELLEAEKAAEKRHA